jgi:hypothetical protein
MPDWILKCPETFTSKGFQLPGLVDQDWIFGAQNFQNLRLSVVIFEEINGIPVKITLQI